MNRAHSGIELDISATAYRAVRAGERLVEEFRKTLRAFRHKAGLKGMARRHRR